MMSVIFLKDPKNVNFYEEITRLKDNYNRVQKVRKIIHESNKKSS